MLTDDTESWRDEINEGKTSLSEWHSILGSLAKAVLVPARLAVGLASGTHSPCKNFQSDSSWLMLAG